MILIFCNYSNASSALFFTFSSDSELEKEIFGETVHTSLIEASKNVTKQYWGCRHTQIVWVCISSNILDEKIQHNLSIEIRS